MPKTQIEKLWAMAGGLAAVLLVLIGYFLFISPRRDDTASVQGQISDAQLQNDGLHARIVALQAQSAKMPSYRKQLKLAHLALPSTSGLPDFLRTLQSLGTATGTNVSSLSIGDPAVLESAPGAAAPSPSPSASASSSTTGGAPAVSAAANVFALPISAQIAGSSHDLDDFLSQLQSVQPRAVLISAITLNSPTSTGTANTGAGQSTLQLSMQAFVAPTNTVEAQQLAQAASP